MDTSTIVFLAAGGVTVSLGILVWYLRGRQDRDVPMEHCRCSCCGQKMRYHPIKQGQVAHCPRCGSKEVLADRPNAPVRQVQRVGEKLRTPAPSTRS